MKSKSNFHFSILYYMIVCYDYLNLSELGMQISTDMIYELHILTFSLFHFRFRLKMRVCETDWIRILQFNSFMTQKCGYGAPIST